MINDNKTNIITITREHNNMHKYIRVTHLIVIEMNACFNIRFIQTNIAEFHHQIGGG